ncbi:MAG: capsule biosynthesis protein [Rhodobacteraceae bacterium]|nr:capsule biosynthesis protein [Paracoccaceae bacterium]
MKPKAKRFRIRRGGATTGISGPDRALRNPGAASPEDEAPFYDGTEEQAEPQEPLRLSAAEQSFLTPKEENEEIRKEGLTGRQLRVARREAQKHGLNAASDYDAVRLLRKNGLDPFKRSDLLELVVSDQGDGPQTLPAAIRHAPPPAIHIQGEGERAREVLKIQRDLTRRRRRRLGLLMIKLAFFVFVPTIIAGYYYYNVATPMYATKSEFVIQQSDSSQGGALGGLFAGTGFATTQDSITVQSYLNSRDAMLRLNREHGFKAHFQQAHIDRIQRLDPDGSNEAAYRIYQKRVKIGYDPTEGIIKMEVIAASPTASEEFSKALISYAEEQVDHLTQRLREDQMKGARESYEEAERKLTEANMRVLALQEKRGVVSAESELAGRMQQINAFELDLKNKRLELAELLDNSRPNRSRVDLAEKAIVRLETLIADERAKLTESQAGGASIAQIQGELVIAQADVATRQLMLSQSLQQLETARIEANRQVRYLSMGVSPVPPDEATYPRAFENTVLAFLIFAGIYLMASLTAAILREQITA